MTVDIAVVGLGFGQEFVPIYLRHPDIGRVAIVDTDTDRLTAVAERFGLDDTYASLADLLAGDGYDAVHITSPVAFHAQQAVAALESGRHCACAVPMATSLEDVDRIIAAQAAAGRNYMMMETAVYGREFFFMRGLIESGELGPVTFLRGMHMQDLDGFPQYWMGYPPMTYSTHALSPLLALADARVRAVYCLGSGRLSAERTGDFDNTFPVQTAIFALDRDDLAAEVTMSFFQVARRYQEGFCVYGENVGVEWPALEGDGLMVHRLLPVPEGSRGRPAHAEVVEPPDRADLLPAEIGGFTRPSIFDPGNGRPPFTVDSHHGGSHPHLVHEFVRSIVEQRPPRVDARTAATWTAPGICGHMSALQGGAAVAVPEF